jgi:phosphopantetheinyl transferase
MVIPHISQSVPAGLKISISHKGRFAAAIVATQEVGIDIERIEPREPGFLDLAFTPAERALFGADEALSATRFWVAKEVAAKQAGTGFQGRPKDFVIDAQSNDKIRVNKIWVSTERLDDFILGWTDDSQKDQKFFGSFFQKRTSFSS